MFYPENEEDLWELTKVLPDSFYILGEGSNTLFVGLESPAIVKPSFKGIKIDETSESHVLTVGCSENWHQLVCFCIERGINGLENLALIPGSVGAAPVQNIGAYGVEL
ncbi:MAG: FAD-binding protein, partial [Alteromonadaceae bacterium]|nr:FAD-binding protein [Alteromonadaceae bacterium]